MKRRFFIILLSIAICFTAFPNNNAVNIYAEKSNETLTISPKDNAVFYTDTEITLDQFNILLNNQSVDNTLVSMSPECFSQPGTQQITFTYFATDNSICKTSLSINVLQLEDTDLLASDNKITLIKDQKIEVSDLPTIYAVTNSGDRRVVTDYTYTMDWDNAILTINYNNLSCKIEVMIIENSLLEITATANKTEVEEGYSFSNSDFDVYAYYKNGTVQQITDYIIQPYTLKANSDSLITITYDTCSCIVKIHVTEKKDGAVLDNPSTNTPSTDVPSTNNPSTNTPSTDVPSTDNPDTNTSNTDVPDTTYSETIKTATINSELPFFDLSADTGNTYYSNHSIKITCNNILNGRYQIVNSNSDISDSKWIDFESEIEITPKGSSIRKLYIQYTSENGDITYMKSKNFLIDTVSPSCNISKKTYTKNITIKCKDSCSGISKIILSGKNIKNNYKLKKEGTYTLKATDLCGNTYSTNFTIKKPAKKLSVSYKAISSKVIKFSAKVTGTTRNVTWSVSNSKIASISKTGKFVAIHKGTCYVTAKIDKLKIKKKIVIQENGNTTSAYVY